jgi:hydrogenase maturation protease
VAGIGNIFLGDDAFGVAVARRLASRTLPAGVTLRDFGIRGLDLAYAMQDEYDAVVLIDALPRGGEPGTLYVLEPELDSSQGIVPDAHGMDPVKVLHLARSLGRVPPRTLVVGCEPGPLESAEPSADTLVQLSPAVASAIEEAVRLVEAVMSELIALSGPDQSARAAG